MSSKIGFWPVFALVTGSQIGSGIFILPASLAPYGLYSLVGWVLSGIGAVALAFVFAELCSRFPYTGGPHIYVERAFGPIAAFFTGWTYWVISWISTGAVVIASISYLIPLIGDHDNIVYLTLEIALLLIITVINLKGLQIAGSVEFILTILKFIPLIIIPCYALYFFNADNFTLANSVQELGLTKTLGKVILITFWGFIGLEAATTPAGSVENPEKNIPKAIILGTITVAFVYFINSAGIMGLINGQGLVNSKAPYAEASQIIFGGNWHLLISLITSIVCIGTLHAWVLASGQIVLGLAESSFMPKIFAKKNSYGAPIIGLVVSSVGILPLLFLISSSNFASQVSLIIDFSVISFLFIYLICTIALLKLLLSENKKKYRLLIASFISIIFCSFIIYETTMTTIVIALTFTLSGLPLYLLWYLPKIRQKK